MKKFCLIVGIFAAMLAFSACEKTDYQHPSHRSGQVK